jgi:hypothetical protein
MNERGKKMLDTLIVILGVAVIFAIAIGISKFLDYLYMR